MSGGSFNMLYNRLPEELIGDNYGDLQRMASRLTAYKRHARAAQETRELVNLIELLGERIETAQERLRGVWKAVEWHVSRDYSEEQVDEAIADYHAKTKADSVRWVVAITVDDFGDFSWIGEVSHRGVYVRMKGSSCYATENGARRGATRALTRIGVLFVIPRGVVREVAR